MSALYNENDAQKATWLRELIRENVIAPGEVDERSIAEVEPADLRGFTQCHFFAGIGVWSYALRLAGWPDDRPVWSGSCPCPSFSCAGKGRGFDDPRHLWPAWYRLIPECNPATIFGEQADDAIGYGWLDLVQTDLERAAYSVGKAVLGACSVGAPHIRQRLYFCAHAMRSGTGYLTGESLGAQAAIDQRNGNLSRERLRTRGKSTISGSANTTHGDRGSGEWGAEAGTWQNGERRRRSTSDGIAGNRSDSHGRLPSDRLLQRSGEQRLLAEDCGTSDLRHSSQRGLPMHGSASGNAGHTAQSGESLDGSLAQRTRLEGHSGHERNGRGPGWLDADAARSITTSGATGGFWRDCDWWYGRDGKYRPIEPGLFPLAHGVANRVLKLRGYGDAIIPQVAAEFIGAYMEVNQ